ATVPGGREDEHGLSLAGEGGRGSLQHRRRGPHHVALAGLVRRFRWRRPRTSRQRRPQMSQERQPPRAFPRAPTFPFILSPTPAPRRPLVGGTRARRSPWTSRASTRSPWSRTKSKARLSSSPAIPRCPAATARARATGGG